MAEKPCLPCGFSTKDRAEAVDLERTLAHHDAAISGLSARMGHVERTLGDHGSILNDIKTAVTKQDARGTIDVHKSVATILHLGILFSMVVGGIIWVTTAQVATMSEKVARHEGALDKIAERVGWVAKVEPKR